MHAERFCWDYWHVPNQYTLLRTPANDFFPEDVFEQLESQLLRFGQERLGCGNISPVWLSAYVHGCRQEMHADLPHGPWAFVLSVTLPPPRKFTGGETFILRPHVLDYWQARPPHTELLGCCASESSDARSEMMLPPSLTTGGDSTGIGWSRREISWSGSNRSTTG